MPARRSSPFPAPLLGTERGVGGAQADESPAGSDLPSRLPAASPTAAPWSAPTQLGNSSRKGLGPSKECGQQLDFNWPERAGTVSVRSCEGGLRCSPLGGGNRGRAREEREDKVHVFLGCAGIYLQLFIPQTFIEPPNVSKALCKVLG